MREVIFDKRNKYQSDLTSDVMSNKYFGVTIDKSLIGFDRYSLRKEYLNEDLFAPTFFLPSYLLKKLYKIIPIDSKDYRKAFIAAVSSPVFEGQTNESKVVQETLKDFHALGIRDPKFIVKLLTNDYFLEEVKNKTEDNSDSLRVFIENELQKELDEVLKEKISKEKRIHALAQEKDDLLKSNTSFKKNNEELETEKMALKHDINNLELSVKSFKKELERLKEGNQNNVIQINLDDKAEIASLKSDKDKLGEQNRILSEELLRNKAYGRAQKWKYQGVLYLLCGLILVFLLLMSFILQDWQFNLVAKFLDYSEGLTDMRKEVIKLVIGLIFVFAQFLLIKQTYFRLLSKSQFISKMDSYMEEERRNSLQK